ncbi:concanavalin A-like lectin/glucanase domain-containing protein [Rhodotorula diobovata]|uniref:Concanavalin A-like lectin/glucanase domain-containing protein n=1 Tax=Rhodotorula diobovata TaxID=5288 RepID=A0A5C5G2S7_9BASI|nr:concanavalin A-like lectin/glucanase domain-containing protein [Rhodotorula diobovata]
MRLWICRRVARLEVREGLQERELELGEAGRAERRHRRQRCVALFALTSPDRPDLAVQVSSKASSKSASPSKTAPAASGSGSGSTGGTSPSGAASPAAPNGGPYKLVSEYEGDTFFDGWTFWADAVDYVDADEAKSAGLISTSASSIIMKVDNTTTLDAGAARKSVRIHSTAAVPIGFIVIADIIKMPWGCSTWPAWWMNGPDWPDGGEIDVLEGVHDDSANQITLHTSDSGCKLTESVDVTGTLVPANNDCNAKVNGNQGCSYAETAANSYGEGFNRAGGGVFVTSFTTDAIEQWFWSRPDVPDNLVEGAPDRATWGRPSASWPSGGCDVGKYFKDQTLIFGVSVFVPLNISGPPALMRAGRLWADTTLWCDPRNYDNAYWEVAYVRVYSV